MVIKIGGMRAYDIDDLAKLLHVTRRTARNYVTSGAIPGAKKIGRKWYVSEKTLQRYLENGGTPNQTTRSGK